MLDENEKKKKIGNQSVSMVISIVTTFHSAHRPGKLETWVRFPAEQLLR